MIQPKKASESEVQGLMQYAETFPSGSTLRVLAEHSLYQDQVIRQGAQAGSVTAELRELETAVGVLVRALVKAFAPEAAILAAVGVRALKAIKR